MDNAKFFGCLLYKYSLQDYQVKAYYQKSVLKSLVVYFKFKLITHIVTKPNCWFQNHSGKILVSYSYEIFLKLFHGCIKFHSNRISVVTINVNI